MSTPRSRSLRKSSSSFPPRESQMTTMSRRSTRKATKSLTASEDKEFLLRILTLCGATGVLSGNNLLWLSCLGHFYAGNLHKLIRSLEIPGPFFQMHQITSCNELNPWGNPESYALSVVDSLFPAGRFPNLQRLDCVPPFYDTVSLNRSSEWIGGATESNPFDLIPAPKVAGSCHPRRRHADVELYFLNQVLARFPNIISFGGVFDMATTDCYHPFTPGVLATMKRAVTSIKLRLDLGSQLQSLTLKDTEHLFKERISFLFPNLTHIKIADDFSGPRHFVTKTIMDAIVRNFPDLKSICFSMHSFFRFTGHDTGQSVEVKQQQQINSLKELFHLPKLQCININGVDDHKVIFMEAGIPEVLYPEILR